MLRDDGLSRYLQVIRCPDFVIGFFQSAAQESLDVTVNTLSTERHVTYLPPCIDYCLWPNTDFDVQ